MKKQLYIVCLITLFLSGCSKRDFLEEKSRSSFVVPATLRDCQAMLDLAESINEGAFLGDLSSDNFFMTDNYWQTLEPVQKNAYIWAPDIYQGLNGITDWNRPYQHVLYANIVLEALDKMNAKEQAEQQYKEIRGAALFFRGFAFFQLSQLFAPVYDSATASADPGIPLRLSAAIDAVSSRASVSATYTQIIKDFSEASALLPVSNFIVYRNRPSKPAALGLLARVYLSMGAYAQGFTAANESLQLYGKLINYNTVPLSSTVYAPFNRLNDETVFQATIPNGNALGSLTGLSNQLSVDTLLYRSYHTNDLRRNIYFFIQASTGAINTNGSYNGTRFPFIGIATDEVYLTRAECAARTGNVSAAMSDLNQLLRNRYKTNTYTDQVAANADAALQIILAERRKELLFRGTRWMDLRRLNKTGANITLTRKLGTLTYTLTPNSPLYTLPIPPEVIVLGGITQNKR